jgi:D-alanyl-lipoteichoic acid acyltransferase DltB (MBOAT superfamily)
MFQDWVFLPFFAVSWGVYSLLPGMAARNAWLLAVSYVFYGLWHPLYPLLVAYATAVDYVVLLAMERGRRRRLWLTLSLLNNIGLLSYFKYGRFAVENFNALFGALGVSPRVPQPSWLLGVGISFFVFRSVSYVMDCYRGQQRRERNIVRHALFVSFFPLLIAGPVERAGNLLPQIRDRGRAGLADCADGLSLFVTGLFKKLALADAIAAYVNSVYGAPEASAAAALLAATFAYAWQIYFDFSGYTDMARGVARLFGFRIMLNFQHPYLATGLQDFWRRWHISLSSWFRDYLYIPLGGSRRGQFRTYLNLFVTMVVSGLWHGAAWTFIAWGAVHGAGSMLTRALERGAFYQRRVPAVAKRTMCFLIVSFGWIFFRSPDFGAACVIIRRIASTRLLADPRFPLLFLAAILAVWVYQFACESRFRFLLARAPVRVALAALMLAYLVLFTGSGGPFIYGAM